jgi:hypothetical protein
MHTNKDYRRAVARGDNWKNRCREEYAEKRRGAQRERYHSHRHEDLLEDNVALSKENSELREALERSGRAPVQVLAPVVVQVLAIQLILEAHVSFRSVPRILALLAARFGLILSIPHYTTIIEWTLRIGLAALQSATAVPWPWIGILDFSIQCGKERVLVVLRLPLSFFGTNKRAPTFADCQTIAVRVRSDWNADTLREELEGLIALCGQPTYWLSDGGGDIAAALRNLPRHPDAPRKPYRVRDVGHVIANALKRIFAQEPEFQAFLDGVAKLASQLRQTDCAELAPPRIRSKGRFQSLSRLVDWFEAFRECVERQFRPGADTRHQHRLQEFLVWIETHRNVVSLLGSYLRLGDNIQGLVKTQGLDQSTWQLLNGLLATLPVDNPFRIEVSAYFAQCLQVSNFCGGVPIVISDDVIESIFGLLKFFTGDGKNSNFGRLALLVPALTGRLTRDRIDDGLASVKSTDLRAYVKEQIPRTLHHKRTKALRLHTIRRRRKGKKLAKPK